MTRARAFRKSTRMSKDMIHFVLRQHAMFLRPKDIISYLAEYFKVVVAPSTITHHISLPENQDYIDRYRKKWETEIEREEFASKKRRVQEVSEIYYRFKRLGTPKALKEAVYAMKVIDEMIQGRSNHLQVALQFNKFEGVETRDLITLAQSTSKMLIDETKGEKDNGV